ncbi:MAG: PQQ-dependent sugar dehydrogenase [Bacteroidota bacterium]
MNRVVALLLSVSWVFCYAQIDLDFVEISPGWSSPVAIENAGDGTNRLFVVERAGRVWIIDDISQGSRISTPFLDIRSKVRSGGEQGLLGLAFHPSYPDTPHCYVNYTFFSDGQLQTRIERYSVSPNPDVADFGSSKTILEFDQPYGNHNGGDISFGPDGYLYIASGDGGSANDPDSLTQDYTNLLGAVLRIDVDGDDFGMEPTANYRIPADNPFANDTMIRSELWSLGLRNPWRMSFDALTGDLYIADVGQNQIEEVNCQSASSQGGEHYGWSCKEGTSTPNFTRCTTDTLIDPIFEYGHNSTTGGFSITGGYVYRGQAMKTIYGKYICADFISGNVWTVDPVDSTFDRFALGQYGNVTTFGESESGELYVATFKDGGTIYRLIDRGACQDRLDVAMVEMTSSDTITQYSANDTLVSSLSSNLPVDLRLSAGEEVRLEPAFEVTEPTALEVLMQSCMDQLLERE